MRTSLALAALLFVAPARADVAIDPSDRGASGVDGVASAPGCSGLVATWSSTAVFVSRDDGATFTEVLGDRGGPVRAVAVTPRCDVWVARGPRLGVVRRDGSTAWRETPTSATTEALAASAAGLLWLGVEESGDLALAHLDGNGRAARLLPSPTRGNAGRAMHLDDDGTIWWMSGSEAACGGGGQSREVAHVDGRAWKEVPWPLDTPGAFDAGPRGWAYALGRCGADAADDGSAGLCAVDRAGRSRRVIADEASSGALLVAASGSRTVAIVGAQLVALDGARATPLATIAGAPRAVALDGRRRPLVVIDGRLHRLEGRRLRALGPRATTPPSTTTARATASSR
jgi:hypothetical protein